MDSVIAITDPASASPDIPINVRANTVSHTGLHFTTHFKLHGGKHSAICELGFFQNVPNFNFLFRFGIMTGPCIRHVKKLVVGRKAQPIGLKNIIGNLMNLPALGIDTIDRFLLIRLNGTGISSTSLVVHQSSIARVCEPDITVWVHHRIVRRIKRLPSVGIS